MANRITLASETIHNGERMTIKGLIDSAIARGYNDLEVKAGSCTLWRSGQFGGRATGYKLPKIAARYIKARLSSSAQA